MTEGAIGEPIIIRFDGLDADQHTLELTALADSLAGLSRIIAASGHFALTFEVSTRRDTQSVRILAQPPKDGCFTIHAIVQYAHEHPMFKEYSIALGAILTGSLVTYIFQRASGKREEMRHLKEALQTAIRELGTRDQPTVDRLLTDTSINSLMDDLRVA
jgi:hypothetical protein